jgi:ABC-type branched-subunit amino acid transport system permease subunit
MHRQHRDRRPREHQHLRLGQDDWPRAARFRRALRSAYADERSGVLSRSTWPGLLALSVVALGGYLALFVVAARAAGTHATLRELLPLLVLGLHFFLTRSRLGKAMRAMADNADLAQVSGINTALVVRVTWIVAGALACVAGTMLALDVALMPDLAFNIVLPIFAAAIVGGLGHAYGAIVGGFLIAFAETLAVFNWTAVLRPLNAILPEGMALPANLALVPTEYKLTVAFVILVVTLLVRPTGIFKGAST